MTISAELCSRSAIDCGAHSSKIYGPGDTIPISDHIAFKQGHMCDYWIFKPFIILKELMSLNIGDILVYSDAGIKFIGPLQSVVNYMGDEPQFLFSNGWKHSEWCKMDVMKAVGIEPGEETQVQASLMYFTISEWSISLVSIWLSFCLAARLIDDSPSVQPNIPTFAAHRHDQAVLGTLAIKYNIPLHWYPVTTAMHLYRGNDQYPAIAEHHRKRNNEY